MVNTSLSNLAEKVDEIHFEGEYLDQAITEL